MKFHLYGLIELVLKLILLRCSSLTADYFLDLSPFVACFGNNISDVVGIC